MSREIWNIQVASKNFYVRVYRWGLNTLMLSVTANIAFVYIDWVYYLHQPDRVYYATSGVTAPIGLTWLSRPNDTSTFLLPSAPIEPEEPKPLPS